MTGEAEAAAADRAFGLSARVAAALVADADDARGGGPGYLGVLAVAPHFGGPLRRARALAASLPELPLDPDFRERLRGRAETRLCALFLSEPVETVRGAALRVAAAVFHRSLIGVVLKPDRDRLRLILGEEAFAVATQEASLLDAPLVQLGAGEPPLDPGDDAALHGRLSAVGTAALVRFAGLTEPALADAVARRLPEAAAAATGAAGLMVERHCGHVLKLLRRRGPGWATFIA